MTTLQAPRTAYIVSTPAGPSAEFNSFGKAKCYAVASCHPVERIIILQINLNGRSVDCCHYYEVLNDNGDVRMCNVSHANRVIDQNVADHHAAAHADYEAAIHAYCVAKLYTEYGLFH